MNNLNLVQIKDTDFIDLATWWKNLTSVIDTLADFDFLSSIKPSKIEMSDNLYTVTLYKDVLNGEILGTKKIEVRSANQVIITTNLDGKTEAWQVTIDGTTIQKERVQ